MPVVIFYYFPQFPSHINFVLLTSPMPPPFFQSNGENCGATFDFFLSFISSNQAPQPLNTVYLSVFATFFSFQLITLTPKQNNLMPSSNHST